MEGRGCLGLGWSLPAWFLYVMNLVPLAWWMQVVYKLCLKLLAATYYTGVCCCCLNVKSLVCMYVCVLQLETCIINIYALFYLMD